MWSLLNAAAVPVRQCPLEVDWSRLPTDPNKGRAAVWTPYHLSEWVVRSSTRSGGWE